MTNTQNLKAENKVAKLMLFILVIGILPLVGILTFYILFPDSQTIEAIAIDTNELPAITSINNPLLSKVMDVYTKTAPLLALVFFLISYKKITIRKDKANIQLIKSLSLYYILFFIIFYITYCFNHELTTSGRLLRTFSNNDYTLTFFYITLYSGLYIFTSMFFWFSIGTYKIIMERRHSPLH